jgi:hypothetical protein
MHGNDGIGLNTDDYMPVGQAYECRDVMSVVLHVKRCGWDRASSG